MYNSILLNGDKNFIFCCVDLIGVNLRTKKKRVGGCEDSQDGFEEPERPMSWEGELSDAEMSIVTGTCLNKTQVLNLSVFIKMYL
jgi:hypothetical protein